MYKLLSLFDKLLHCRMLFNKLLIFATFALHTLAEKSPSDELKVSVYYESLCPDSIRFITTQLKPGYDILGDSFLNIDFVPFGKATATKVNDTWNFECQHGPNECHGNKVHSCVLHLTPQEKAVEFIFCAMSSGDASDEEKLKKCANSTGIPWDITKYCLESGQADELLVANGNRTNSLINAMKFIPTIIFNDAYSDEVENNVQQNFLNTACKALGNLRVNL